MSVSGVDTSTCKPIPLSMDWGRFPAAVGRDTASGVLTSVSNESVETSVLPPRLGVQACAFVGSSWGRRVTGCIGIVWSTISLSTNWGGWPTADCTGRETSEVLTNPSKDSVEELEKGVLPPLL